MSDDSYKNPLKFDIDKKEKAKTFRIKNPRLFIAVASSCGLLIFFSKPLYDIFLNKQTFDIEKLKREHKPRFSK